MHRILTYWGITTLVVGTMSALITGCAAQTAKPDSGRRFPVIAYLPDYRLQQFPKTVPAPITDLIYFSIEPLPNGDLALNRAAPDVLKQLGALKKGRPLRILIALGGWSRSGGFAPMAADNKTRAHFVRALTQFCLANGLDGADFDWEHPSDANQERSYGVLLTETRAAFKPHGLRLFLTVAAWQNLPAEAFQAADRIQVMAYDHDGKHSTYEGALADVKMLLDKGAPKNKLVLGVPSYGRKIADANRDMTYADIVARYHPAPDVDEVDGIYFNNIRTIRRKARYARDNGLGGVMFWELGQDSADKTSLVLAIRDALSK